jgi:hypothetical protein
MVAPPCHGGGVFRILGTIKAIPVGFPVEAVPTRGVTGNPSTEKDFDQWL